MSSSTGTWETWQGSENTGRGMMNHRWLLVLAVLGGCDFSKLPVPDGCASNDDCDGGTVCAEHACRTLCSIQGDCVADQYCASDGMCLPRQEGAGPEVTTVAGNDLVDPA